MSSTLLGYPRIVRVTSLLCVLLAVAVAGAESPVGYNRDIRPLLSDRCFQCHGPDASHRQADLRLHDRESAYTVIEPGDVEASELMARVTSDDPDIVMPPPESGKTLDANEIELLKKWVASRAKYEPHWSFIAPKRPSLPTVVHEEWPSGAIDRFVLARLEEEGLEPSAVAGKITLLRRVTFDLTGLPPTREEVHAFLADDSPDAYEKVVERLLASPRYGEHMARYWLDAVRYGDTHGLHLDNYREMWPYRDWVVRAFNDNMGWDDFTIKQIAGDLLPGASLDDQVASGYNRCHITTSEGGSIPEEVEVRNVVDRVSTTGTVFLGLTMGCAVCHDHKFDPITAKDFYSSYAYFNNLDGKPLDDNAAAPAPVIRAPTPEQQEQQAAREQAIAQLTARLESPLPAVDEAQVHWEADWSDRLASMWNIVAPVEVKSTGGATFEVLEDGSVLASGANPAKDVHEWVMHLDQEGVVAIRLEALVDRSLFNTSLGRSANANAVLSEIEAEVRPLADPTAPPQKVRFVAATADHSQDKFPVVDAIDGLVDDAKGWGVEGHVRPESRTAVFVAAEPFGFEGGTELRVRLSYQSIYSQHALGRVRLAVSSDASYQPVTMGDWSRVGPFKSSDGQEAFRTDYGPESALDLALTYNDGQLAWTPQPELTDGEVHALSADIGAWYLHRKIYSPEEREITVSLGSDDAVRVWINGEQAHENNVSRSVAADQDQVRIKLRSGENDLLVKIVNFGGPAGFYFRDATKMDTGPDLMIARILATPPEERTEQDRTAIRTYYRRQHSPEWKQMTEELAQAKQAKAELEQTFPTTLVMKERAEPQPAYLLKRGQYDLPDKELGPLPRQVPSFLPPLPEGAPDNRLGYAQWLIAPEHPLMARVAVNRFWQQCFGLGIVETSDDFGAQGSWPSHPGLLDWLAVEFRESGWDTKHMMKLIVMSNTYRQSSKSNPELVLRDPRNRLLARGPRFRLDAEVLRDQALAVSGILVEKLGGPGVKPPQPAGIWEAVAYVGSNTGKFAADSGPEKVHRRSLYTFWKRTAPPPQMSTLDAPSRESCVVRRERTNTPLAALLLLNDPQYVEAARKLADRAMELGGNPEETARVLFELATVRPPEDDEVATLMATYEASLARYEANPDAATKLLSVGEAPRNESFAPAQAAAWTLVANTVLNLDEVVTKE